MINNWYERHFFDSGELIVYVRVANQFIKYEDRIIIEYSFN